MSQATGIGYDPYDVVINADPYPAFRRLREEAPLYYNEQYDFFAVSRYEDVERGLVDHKNYISGRGGILELIKAGLGIGVLAGWAFDPARRSGAVVGVRIGRRGVRRTWTAVRLKDRPSPLWMTEFVNLLALRGPSAVWSTASPQIVGAKLASFIQSEAPDPTQPEAADPTLPAPAPDQPAEAPKQ